MANLVRSLGYSLGKVHSGLLAHLCNLYRDGTKEPFESLLGALGAAVPTNPNPQREWNRVDLAILDQGTGAPRILFEVKVDDHEGCDSEANYQTVRYARDLPPCVACFFLTLGMGEYYHSPRSDRFKWVRIREFLRALDAVRTKVEIVFDWKEEIRREIDLQDRAATGDRSRSCDYRTGSWNIYLLGQLAAELQPALRAESINVETTCYPYGTRPDTILNFGFRGLQYMEINYSGRLNLKVSLDTQQPKNARRELVLQAIERWRMATFASNVEMRCHPTGKVGESKTVVSFDVGLVDREGLAFVRSRRDTLDRILSVLRVFYGTLDGETAASRPMQTTGGEGGG
jgi:hypothetical protein